MWTPKRKKKSPKNYSKTNSYLFEDLPWYVGQHTPFFHSTCLCTGCSFRFPNSERLHSSDSFIQELHIFDECDRTAVNSSHRDAAFIGTFKNASAGIFRCCQLLRLTRLIHSLSFERTERVRFSFRCGLSAAYSVKTSLGVSPATFAGDRWLPLHS